MNPRIRHAAIVALVMLASTFTLGRKMSQSGLNVDDGWMGLAALHSPFQCRYHLSILGRDLPLAQNAYTPPWSAYALWPVLKVMPDRMAAIRGYTLAAGVLAAGLVYALAFLVSGDVLVSAGCAFAVGSSAFLVKRIKMGFSDTGIAAVDLGLLGLIFLILAVRRRSAASWRLACLAIGLGPGIAAYGLAPFAAWFLAAAWLRRNLAGAWASRRLLLAESAALLSLGLAPLLLANVLYPGCSVSFVFGHVLSPQPGLKNSNVLAHLALRLDELTDLFGHSLPCAILAAFAAGMLAIDLWRFRRRGDHIDKTRLLPLLFFVVVLLLSTITLNSFDIYQITVLLPLGFAAIAAVSRGLGSDAQPAWRRGTICCLLAWGVALNVFHLGEYWRAVDSGKMDLNIYAKIEEVAGWLEDQRARHVLLMDERFAVEPFEFLSDGAVAPRMFLQGPRHAPRLPTRFGPLEAMVGRKEPVYLISEYSDGVESPAMDVARAFCRARGMRLRVAREFDRVDGARGIRVYELRRGGRLTKSDNPATTL